MNPTTLRYPKSYEEFLTIVGELIVEYSKAEMTGALLVNGITRSKRGFEIYREISGSKEKIKNYIRAISQLHHPSSKVSIRIFEELNECREERNHIAHSLWMHYPKIGSQNIFYSASFDINLKNYDINKVTIEKIKDSLDKIKRVSGDIAVEFGEVTVLKRKRL